MKAEHRYVQRRPEDPVPEDALATVREFTNYISNADLQKLDFAIGLAAFETDQKTTEGHEISAVTGMMVGAPPRLMVGLVELAGNLLGGHPDMQKMFLLMLIADFAARKGTPPPDEFDLDEKSIELGKQLMEKLRTMQ